MQTGACASQGGHVSFGWAPLAQRIRTPLQVPADASTDITDSSLLHMLNANLMHIQHVYGTVWGPVSFAKTLIQVLGRAWASHKAVAVPTRWTGIGVRTLWPGTLVEADVPGPSKFPTSLPELPIQFRDLRYNQKSIKINFLLFRLNLKA